MLQLVLVAILIAVIFYYYAVKPLKYWKSRGVKQTNPWWFFGDIWGTIIQKYSFTEILQNAYKTNKESRYYGMYQFTTPTLVIKDLELIKQIGVKDFEHFTDHLSFIPEKSDPLWAKNLLTLKEQKWKEMRPILSPSFTSSKMRGIFVLMSECAENFVKFFLKKNQDCLEIEMKDTFSRFTNDVIATTAFGLKTDSLENPDNEFYHMGKKATDFDSFWKNIKIAGFVLLPKLCELLGVTLFDKDVRTYFTELIDHTIKTREEKGIVRPDMIHLLMEAKRGIRNKEDTGFAVAQESSLGKGVVHEMTNLDITAQAIIFFVAGFDTVSATMCFLAYELALNPEIQTKLRKEIQETLEKCNGKLTYEGLLKMNYLDMVVSESLRKWPTAVITDRVCTKPYTISPVSPDEKHLHIEKGTVLWFPIICLHRDSNHYPNPELFDPERFHEDNKENIKPYTYLPFGVGPRNCIGSRFALLEIKIVLFYLLATFELAPSSKTDIPLEISKKQFNVTAANGFWLNIKKLKN